jgi:hypothetical protein
MPITTNFTLESGLVVTYHRVISVVTTMHLGAEMVIASVQSWVDKTRADNGEEAHFSSYQVALTPQTGIVAKAELALVADATCPLFGGTVAADVVLTDLEAAKTRKRLEIESAKNVEMYADKTTTLGVFGSTESDNNKLSIAIQIAQLSPQDRCGYKDVNGTWTSYTSSQLGQIALEIASQVLPLYSKESVLVAQIDAATTVAEVESINWK